MKAMTSQVTMCFMVAIAFTLSACVRTTHLTQAEADKLAHKVTAGDVSALHTLRSAAEDGNPAAQTDLGALYQFGWGVPKDMNKAVDWYRKAAGQGYALGQFSLGDMYMNGRGVAKNYVKAAEWCRKAAKQGDSDAQAMLGQILFNGWGVNKNMHEAAVWYRRAAEQGNGDGQYRLGEMYANGHGQAKDLVLAYQWLTLAKADTTLDPAETDSISRILHDVRRQMSPDEISRGDQAISAWKEKHD